MIGCRRFALVVVLLAFGATGARAATQMVLGAKLDIRNPRVDRPSARSAYVFAREEPYSPNLLVGDPTLSGASLRVIVRSSTAVQDETFALPAAGWRSYLTRHDWPVYKVLSYSNRNTGGPVRSVIVTRAGYASPEGMPPPVDPRPGEFRLKVRLVGRDGAFALLPPAPGEDGGIVLAIAGGDTYCVAFGGPAGGRIIANTLRRFAVKSPTAEDCPAGIPPGGP